MFSDKLGWKKREKKKSRRTHQFLAKVIGIFFYIGT